MIKYFPVMFAAGRVSRNRALVTATDTFQIYVIWLAATGQLPVLASVAMVVSISSFYLYWGYHMYFRLINQFRVVKTRISYKSGIINAALVVYSNDECNETYEHPLYVKKARGVTYHRYVLFIYMSLCNSLMQYAREKQTDKS